MYDSCPGRTVGYGIPAQSSVRLTSVVSIRWHGVHTCQSQVLASHTQRVNVGLRDNARRLCPRTALSGQYMFPVRYGVCSLSEGPQFLQVSSNASMLVFIAIYKRRQT